MIKRINLIPGKEELIEEYLSSMVRKGYRLKNVKHSDYYI